ncbi:hypothetical protein [Aliagarivorans taiwanensis]|uniref:hypothetical protein n=1 Tax=Aliagarivorans taiwanensis TaxID=561966 RepID=UPI00042558BB|nr:hypothetical protein [Aliagarivorans taiwanensis]
MGVNHGHCPYCETPLGDLNKLMDKLKITYPDSITAPMFCCGNEVTAYKYGLTYYISKADGSDRQMIGAD